MNEQEFQMRWTRFWKVVIVVAMGLAMVANALAGVVFFAPDEEPEIVARSSYNTDCYTEQGGSKIVAASGCEIEVQSGATFDLQDGATTDFSAGSNFGGAVTMTSSLDVAGNVSSATGAFTITDAVDIAGNLTSATGALTIADTLQVTGLADFDAGLTFGSVPLRPVGIAAANQELECGTTTTFTATLLVDPTNVTTPTYVVVSQVTAPVTTAAYLHVSDPTTTTFTLTSLENDFTAGTTGITAHWCALGTD